MKKKIALYIIIQVIAILLCVIAIAFLDNTKVIAPTIIVISIYLFVGSIIKLCQMNAKLKDTILCSLDLLFWLP